MGQLEHEDGTPHEQLLARLLDEITNKVQSGESVQLTDYQRAYPEAAEDLAQLWGAVMVADAVGKDGKSEPRAEDVPIEIPESIGDYRLREELGRGGMGIVFRARQESLNRDVAVKMLLEGRWATVHDQARIRAEAAAAARLDHPNIVPVYDVGQQEGTTYFSMKYISGSTLSERLKKGPISPRVAAALMLDVSRAIEYAHRQGVLHRDLKPSNILLDADGSPHVSDFGLAKTTTDTVSLTRTGAVLGTPAYMAPEQAAGNRGQVGPRSDVYSLGCILYHMLTGRPPFHAASPVDIVLQVLEQDPPLPRMINPEIDRDLEMITLRCLQKPQDLRYSSADDLAEDLSAYLSDEPISARSGQFTQVVARLFRETHHAPVLENWGLLWMWHGVVLLATCVLTSLVHAWNISRDNSDRYPYFLLWTVGLGTWAAVFWALRRRMGPVTFVERQIAHVWASSMISIGLLFPVEYLLGLPVLTLSPVLALSSGAVFLVKAGILTGSFYVQAAALFATSLAMARWPDWAHLIFGVVACLCFFGPGWKYWDKAREK